MKVKKYIFINIFGKIPFYESFILSINSCLVNLFIDKII
jgi:hypothetical protein